MGSSPRMRGAPSLRGGSCEPPGIIPAYAGSTGRSMASRAGRRDHPRVCGEHNLPMRESSGLLGSSPRMRGAQHNLPGAGHRDGIIPAYAGSTAQFLGHRPELRDHPRVCGEHETLLNNDAAASGSSPRMREARGRGDAAGNLDGIIPAYAGSTYYCYLAWLQIWDHPRVCGEHYPPKLSEAYGLGSSPRMRGARSCEGGRKQAWRIIPAYAGSTT